MSPPRIALVGAARSRQGLGPFVARDLAALGARIVAVAGRDAGRAETAAQGLRESLGEAPAAYGDVVEMLERERPDALGILSPSETHERYLKIALQVRVHVLCEKPLIWQGGDLAGRAARLVDGFRENGLLLDTLTQWPEVLDTFRALHPDTPQAPPARFGMRLSPESEDRQGLGDALPHPLSVLQRLAPGADARVEQPRFESIDSDGGLRVRFVYAVQDTRIESSVDLRRVPAPPRPAALQLDDRRGERRIVMPGYRMELCDGERAVPMPDPLRARLDAWLRDLRAVLGGAKPPDPAPLAQRMQMLETLLEAFG